MVQFFEIEELYKDAVKKYKVATSHFVKGNASSATLMLTNGAKSFGAAEMIARYSRLSEREKERVLSMSLEAEMGFSAAIYAMNHPNFR